MENFLTDKRYRILVDGKLIPADVQTWGKWFEDGEARRVGHDVIGDIKISTVCLGMDHGWGDKPLWFETMIFGGEHDQDQWRYETLEEAKTGHAAAVKLVKGEQS